MRHLRTAIARLSPRRRLAVAALIFVIALTWLAVCVILASYLV